MYMCSSGNLAPNQNSEIVIPFSGVNLDYILLSGHVAFSFPYAGQVVRLVVAASTAFGSTNVGNAGFRTGGGWGTGWSDAFVEVETTTGVRFQGKGGLGGNGAAYNDTANDPFNPGTIGGPGGGGAGRDVGPGAPNFVSGHQGLVGSNGSLSAGGGGRSAKVVGGTVTPVAATAGQAGGAVFELASDGPTLRLRPASGTTLQLWSGAGGGGGGNASSSSGAGGGPGLAGVSGGSAGGAAGAIYVNPSKIVEVGPGMFDKRGN